MLIVGLCELLYGGPSRTDATSGECFGVAVGFPAKLGMLASCQLAAVPNANAEPFFFVGSAKVPKEGSDGIGIGIGIGTWHKVGTAWHGWHEVGIGPDATWQQEA